MVLIAFITIILVLIAFIIIYHGTEHLEPFILVLRAIKTFILVQKAFRTIYLSTKFTLVQKAFRTDTLGTESLWGLYLGIESL